MKQYKGKNARYESRDGYALERVEVAEEESPAQQWCEIGANMSGETLEALLGLDAVSD